MGKPQFGKIAYKKKTNMRVFPDIRKAKKIIGWSPKINFIKGLKLTIRSSDESAALSQYYNELL